MLSVDYSSGQLMCVCLSLTLSVPTLRLMKVLLSYTLVIILVLNSWIMGGKFCFGSYGIKCHSYANEYSLTVTMFCNNPWHSLPMTELLK